MEIHKKTWPEYFELIEKNKKRFDLRIADFKAFENDIIILDEYNPDKKEFTGKSIKKKIKSLIKFNPTEMYNLDDLKKYGFYIIELE